MTFLNIIEPHIQLILGGLFTSLGALIGVAGTYNVSLKIDEKRYKRKMREKLVSAFNSLSSDFGVLTNFIGGHNEAYFKENTQFIVTNDIKSLSEKFHPLSLEVSTYIYLYFDKKYAESWDKHIDIMGEMFGICAEIKTRIEKEEEINWGKIKEKYEKVACKFDIDGIMKSLKNEKF